VAAQTYRAACAVKNGRTYYGKARAKCKKCGRQFVLIRQHPPLSSEQKRRIELLLAERISLEGICRVPEIKAHQLYAYMDELHAEIRIMDGAAFS
jgi:transposase-like protein